MREVKLIYVEVMNETEQVFIFETTFNKHRYAHMIILNTALSIEMQDMQLRELIGSLANMTQKDAANAVKPLKE